MTVRWYSSVPCEKFTRATFIPAEISFLIISSESEAGPMVQTIFVRRVIPSCPSVDRAPQSLTALEVEYAGLLHQRRWLLCYVPSFPKHQTAICRHQRNAGQF